MTQILRIGAAVTAAGVVAALVACSPMDPFQGAPDRTDSVGTDAQDAIWSVPADACDDDAVRAAVEDSLASGVEGPGNSLLATPDEVPRDARERQARAWRDLDAEALAFQLCLRALQTDHGAEPSATASPVAAPQQPSPSASAALPFGCLPPLSQERLATFLFDLTDDPDDGRTVLRMTNSGADPLDLTVGDVGIRMLGSTDEAATDLDPDSVLDGFDARLEPGETRTFEVDIDMATVACTDRADAAAFAPILVAALDGEPLPHPVLGAAWRP